MFDVKTFLAPFRSFGRLNIDHLDREEIERFQRAGTIVVNPARRRPRYFDGRFLAAHDLTREQDYFLQRQADLARATGPGVIHGLMVSRVDDTRVKIQSGSGVTPAGDLVVLREVVDGAGNPEEMIVDLADVARMMQLDLAFGLDTIPNEPPRRRSGLFVLALRPVEFTANPIAAYPASITERRAIDDGEIIEGVAVTLVPYRDDHSELDPFQQRAHVARRIFVERSKGGVPAEALPVAMLQLDRGFILWIDPYMVRREVGAEHAGVAGFGLAPRGLRESYVLQQEEHLLDVMAERASRPGGLRFPAAEMFRALPPAGQLPRPAITRIGSLRYSQSFFPPQMPCAMAVVPDDEVSVLVEEALLLPPIDLTVPQEDLDFTQILVLLPVPRWLIEDGVAVPGPLNRDRRRAAIRLVPAAPGIPQRRLQTVDVFRKLLPRMASTVERSKATAISGFKTAAIRELGAIKEATTIRAATTLEARAPARMIAADREAAPIFLAERAITRRDLFLDFTLDPIDARWLQALQRAEEMGNRLWYVRARTLQWRVVPADPNSTETPLPFRADESHPIDAVNDEGQENG